MMTYTPVPFMDAKPVNVDEDLSFPITKLVSPRYFRISHAVNMFADLALPHKWYSAVTNFAINAAKLRNIFTYTPYPSPISLHTPSCTFTYSPRAYRLGRVYNWVGGYKYNGGG